MIKKNLFTFLLKYLVIMGSLSFFVKYLIIKMGGASSGIGLGEIYDIFNFF